MTIGAGVIFSRFIHYVAVITFFGAALFPIYAFAPRNPSSVVFQRSIFAVLAILALLTGLSWFFFTTAAMTESFALDSEALWSVATETRFGSVWSIHLVAALLTLIAVLFHGDPERARTHWLLTAFCGITLVTLAGVGHTQNQQGPAFVFHTIADSAHLLAAGVWLGGLVCLLALLTRPANQPVKIADHHLIKMLRNFSIAGYAAVATLIVSGLVNSFYLVGSSYKAFAAPYGQLLLIKLGAFSAILILAAANRFWLMPRLEIWMAAGRNPDLYVRRLRLHVAGEQFFGLGILSIVSVLGTTQPAISAMPA
jgi:copper resistance protein D